MKGKEEFLLLFFGGMSMGIQNSTIYKYVGKEFKPGRRNLISDVAGIKVGHVTLAEGEIQTGLTAVQLDKDIFRCKMPAACHVINGFGKTAGLVQVEELGSLESHLVFTNTLAVGRAWQGLCHCLLEENPASRSVNPLVFECNDGHLNNIRRLMIREDMVREALNKADRDFAEGAVGAGRGMVCHGLSGGIGSASRQVDIAEKKYTLAALVLTNHGKLEDFMIAGVKLGRELYQEIVESEKLTSTVPSTSMYKLKDEGSCIVILACDIPLSSWQLKRIAHRAIVGISQSGSKLSHGSGEIVLAFSTANRERQGEEESFHEGKTLNNYHMNTLFRMAIESVEEAVLSSLWHAESVTGFQGNKAPALRDYMSKLSF